MRRLFSAPRVILLVALIGAAQVLLFFQLILPDVTRVRPYPTAFSGRWEIGGVLVRGQELTVIVVIPLLVTALTLFMNRTKYGLAIRASAANADAARLAGINIKKMSTIVWVISGALAATAAMLFAPLNPAGASALGVGPGMLLRVLAAALIGGMASLPLALAGGVAIGIGESLINYNYNDQRGLLDLVLFVVVLVTLLVSGRRRGLAEADSGRWSFAPRIRPIPAALQSKWWVRSLPAFGVGLVALLALVPARVPGPPVAARGVEPRAALRARRALADRAHGLGRTALARAVRVRRRRRLHHRRARPQRRRLHPRAGARGVLSPRWLRSSSARRRCGAPASTSRSPRSRSR